MTLGARPTAALLGLFLVAGIAAADLKPANLKALHKQQICHLTPPSSEELREIACHWPPWRYIERRRKQAFDTSFLTD